MFKKAIFSIFLLIVSAFGDPLSVAEAFGLSAKTDSQNVEFRFDLAKDIYVYKDTLKVISKGKTLNDQLNLPNFINDGSFDVYPEKFSLFVPISLLKEINQSDSFNITLEYQGCAKNGICYQPQVNNYNVSSGLSGYKIALIPKDGDTTVASSLPGESDLSEQDSIAKNLSDKGFVLSLITFFGYGILLSLTPCIFPMIPILSSIIVSKSGDKLNAKRGFWLSFIYVFAMALAYAVAGIVASIFGAGLSGMLQTPAVLIGFSLVFVALALSMFGLYELQMPLKIQNLLNKKAENKDGIIGIFIMGFLSALIASPCVAAPLAGVLLYIAQSGNVLFGGSALFIMGLGMGVPLLIIGASSGKLLPRPGIWMDNIKRLFGFIMIFMAIWLSARVLGSKIEFLLYGITGVFMSVYFGAFDSTNENSSSGKKALKSVSLILFIYAFILIIGSFTGAKSLANPLANFGTSGAINNKEAKFISVSNVNELENAIKSSSKPVMIDFYATWCVSCNELDEITFKEQAVLSRLENLTLIRVDVTKGSKEDNELMNKFGLIGPPALIFYKGEEELKSARVIGFYPPEKFLAHLDKFNL
ncbi:protein-disulfide reductase DsbD [Campylobacter sp. CCUG 57310]|uniref:protein-disulfide reductase DsbD n=1 Tax=Campylobacter sp. CCUG 57310 TaxID=2517362 RepID=UPI0015662F02|nr:protein-disulfide reductase DsbD [Campylobacter sp. CCUG 57310]QKF92399.1 thiol:disulfide interchange protein DsbD [Campylobacter sp. CCUG 57310]